MSNLQSQLFTIPADSRSVAVRINLTGTRAIASIATNSNVTADVNSKKLLKVNTYWKKLDAWLPVNNAEIEIMENVGIAFDPFTNLRGEEEVEFELSEIQTNDVTFEIKFTEI